MRRVPESDIEPWDEPAFAIDGNGQGIGVQPGPRHNWARWGRSDQRGTANLLSPERVVRASLSIRSGKQFSLALPIGPVAFNLSGRAAPQHFFTSTTSDHMVGDRAEHRLAFSDDVVVLPLQASTQLDGHAHFAVDGLLYNGYWQGVVTATSGARRLGVHHQARGIVGRAVLLDVARQLDTDPFETAITADMLDEVCRRQNVVVGSGDIVLVRTGYVGAVIADHDLLRRRRQSGLAFDTIDWIADHDVAMVAADNRTVEVIPSGSAELLPWHGAALRDLGLLVGELFDLDDLAHDCDADSRYEMFFSAAPLPVVNGAGSPLNPLAIK